MLEPLSRRRYGGIVAQMVSRAEEACNARANNVLYWLSFRSRNRQRMPTSHALTLFLATAFALNLTPGPDMLYIAGRSARDGRGAGMASTLGVSTGTLVHITLVALGLAAVLEKVSILYVVVRIAGAAYLVLLGIRAWHTAGALQLEGYGAGPTVEGLAAGRTYERVEPQGCALLSGISAATP